MPVDIAPFLQLGVAGVMLYIFVSLHLRAIKRAEVSADNAEKNCAARDVICQNKIDEHVKFQRDTLIPLIEETNTTHRDLTEAQRELIATLKQTRIGSGSHPTVSR